MSAQNQEDLKSSLNQLNERIKTKALLVPTGVTAVFGGFFSFGVLLESPSDALSHLGEAVSLQKQFPSLDYERQVSGNATALVQCFNEAMQDDIKVIEKDGEIFIVKSNVSKKVNVEEINNCTNRKLMEARASHKKLKTGLLKATFALSAMSFAMGLALSASDLFRRRKVKKQLGALQPK